MPSVVAIVGRPNLGKSTLCNRLAKRHKAITHDRSFGSYRMGPIFGGMLLSGEKVAADIAAKLRG